MNSPLWRRLELLLNSQRIKSKVVRDVPLSKTSPGKDSSHQETSGMLTKHPSENAVVARGIGAINHIYQLTSRIPHLMKQSHLESNEGEIYVYKPTRHKLTDVTAWSAYWLPIFQTLTTQCTNPCREIRH